MNGGFANLLWKFWYPFLTRLSMNSRVNFLNYGYAEAGQNRNNPPLKDEDEPDRPCIQLYDRVVSAVDVRGLDVLEVSCGHGGGAAYVACYMSPRSMHGVDRNARAIAVCKARHRSERLTFSCGNALHLDFPNETFDVVVNLEASHCYPDVPRFLAEVQRVLRPGGHFLYADFRDTGKPLALLHQQLETTGMEILSCDDISANVVRGMQLNSAKYLELIQKHVPGFLQKLARDFAGVKGSSIYESLESGSTVYLCCRLRKPGAQIV